MLFIVYAAALKISPPPPPLNKPNEPDEENLKCICRELFSQRDK